MQTLQKPQVRRGPASFLKLAGEVAGYYGFRPIGEAQKKVGSQVRNHTFASAASITAQAAGGKDAGVVMSYWASSAPTHVPPFISQDDELGEFGLSIVGAQEALAEAVLLKTMRELMAEWGVEPERIRLNTLGDKESKQRFEREAVTYVRKHAAHLDPACRETLDREPLKPYTCQSELCESVVISGPRAMNFLSEKSRLHFKDMLEQVEALALPYEFDDRLLGDEREQRVLFAVDVPEDSVVVGGMGGRYDDYFKRLRGKEMPGVSASIYFNKRDISKGSFEFQTPETPSIYFIQLGARAKLEGLAVVDMLRAARVPILQSFDSAKLGPQLTAAREHGVEHLIIMGAREALDRTVLVRSMDNSSQQVVELSNLPKFLRSLR